MEFLRELWLSILVSSVLAFVLSSIIHMVLKYHKNDFKKLPDEDGAMDALRKLNLAPGDYHMPMCDSPEDMKRTEVQEKLTKGPVALITVIQPGMPNMGKYLAQWFLYLLIVNFFVAYVVYHSVPIDGHYLRVFRIAATTAFMGYSLAQIPDSIWYHRNCGTTLRNMFDGLLYALLAGGTFGWLWPN
jgi:hypothetical protein